MNIFADGDTKSWMRSMPESFGEWLEQELTDNVNQLRIATDLVMIGRFQGRLHILVMLRELRKAA